LETQGYGIEKKVGRERGGAKVCEEEGFGGCDVTSRLLQYLPWIYICIGLKQFDNASCNQCYGSMHLTQARIPLCGYRNVSGDGAFAIRPHLSTSSSAQFRKAETEIDRIQKGWKEID